MGGLAGIWKKLKNNITKVLKQRISNPFRYDPTDPRWTVIADFM